MSRDNEDLVGFSYSTTLGEAIVVTGVMKEPMGYVTVDITYPDGSTIPSCRRADQVRVRKVADAESVSTST